MTDIEEKNNGTANETEAETITQSRLKSPVFWLALAAQAASILVLLGVLGDVEKDTILQVVSGLLQVFVLFGVLNDPTSKNVF